MPLKEKRTRPTSPFPFIDELRDLLNQLLEDPSRYLTQHFEKTLSQHTLRVYDLDNNRTMDIQSSKVHAAKPNPHQFFKSSQASSVSLSSQKLPFVKQKRLDDPKINQYKIEDAKGHELIPCIAHGEFVPLKGIEADHIQAASEITRIQKELVDRLNADPVFAGEMMKHKGVEKLFIKTRFKDNEVEKYYGTQYFYRSVL